MTRANAVEILAVAAVIGFAAAWPRPAPARKPNGTRSAPRPIPAVTPAGSASAPTTRTRRSVSSATPPATAEEPKPGSGPVVVGWVPTA